MSLQGTLVSKRFLPAYLMVLERSMRSPGLVSFAFYSGGIKKPKKEKEKEGKRHSQAVIHFKNYIQLQST